MVWAMQFAFPKGPTPTFRERAGCRSVEKQSRGELRSGWGRLCTAIPQHPAGLLTTTISCHVIARGAGLLDSSRTSPGHIPLECEAGPLSGTLGHGKEIYRVDRLHMPWCLSLVSLVAFRFDLDGRPDDTFVLVIKVMNVRFEDMVSKERTAARSISWLTSHFSGAVSLARYASHCQFQFICFSGE